MKHINKITILIVLLFMVLLPTRLVLGQSSGGEIGFFEEVAVRPEVSFEVPVEVRSTNDLFAVDIEIMFDPQVLQAQDADPDSEGIQIGLGEFLDPGLMLYNDVDNQTGLIRFAMSQVNPSQPKAGDGILLVIYFEAVEEGESTLEINKLEASNNRGDAVTVEPVDGVVMVESGAADRQATAIPVVNPTAVIIVPTALHPTQTATAAHEPTATQGIIPTSQPTATQGVTPTSQPTTTEIVDATPTTQPEFTETKHVETQNQELDNIAEEQNSEQGSEAEKEENDTQSGIFNSWWFAGFMFLILIILAYFFFFNQSKINQSGRE